MAEVQSGRGGGSLVGESAHQGGGKREAVGSPRDECKQLKFSSARVVLNSSAIPRPSLIETLARDRCLVSSQTGKEGECQGD